MDIFNLFDEEACLFCDGVCTCWCVKLGPGSPVYFNMGTWAVVQSVNSENETVILFAKETGRQEIPWKELTPTLGYK